MELEAVVLLVIEQAERLEAQIKEVAVVGVVGCGGETAGRPLSEWSFANSADHLIV